MNKRTLIERRCAECLEIQLVRKDGAGKCCRKCRARINRKNAIPKDMVGKKFGRLQVESLAYIKKNAYWNCICECGNKCIINGSKMRNETTKSCGCMRKTQKGLSMSKTYNSWRAMLQRCYDTSIPHYKRYGEKGIQVCERWKESFENFLLDMGERPLNKTLDRIDSQGNYNKENCKWSTIKEQCNNRNKNILIEYCGKVQTLTQWSEEYGINWSTLRKRIVELGWNIEKSLTKKVGKYAVKER